MRRGINPAKRGTIRAHQVPLLGMVTIVWIPSLRGFFEKSLEVLKMHLTSLRQTLPPESELIVWDNGSCEPVRRYLWEQFQSGIIDYLLLSSYNLGKAGVLNWIFAALPYKFIGYTDSDVYFYPGWWEATLAIFQAFPKAGMVSAQPGFFDVLRGASKMPELVEQEGFRITYFYPTPQDYFAYLQGIGQKPSDNIQLPALPGVQHQRIQAVIRATHMQFVMPAEVARHIPPLPAEYALNNQADRILHQRVEALGFWQLSTLKSYVYHMGNTPSFPTISPTTTYVSTPHMTRVACSWRTYIFARFSQWLQKHPWLHQRLEHIYHIIFKLLYEKP